MTADQYSFPVNQNYATLTMDPYAAGTTLTVEHGLGAAPDMIVAYLECKIAEIGYVPGERIFATASAYSYAASAANQGYITGADASRLFIVTENVGRSIVPDKATQVSSLITAANWKIAAQAYRFSA